MAIKTLIFVLIFLCIGWHLHKKRMEGYGEVPYNRALITYHKSGGIMGMTVRLEILKDETYRLYNRDALVKTGKIDANIWDSVLFIVNNHWKLLQRYCKIGGYSSGADLINRVIDVNGRRIILGDFDKTCIPDEFYGDLLNVDRLAEIPQPIPKVIVG